MKFYNLFCLSNEQSLHNYKDENIEHRLKKNCHNSIVNKGEEEVCVGEGSKIAKPHPS